MSLWWSFILTAFGATGMFLSYRSYSSYAGPAFGLWIQLVWVTYAIESMQWWFIVSAFLYGVAHIYGIGKRRHERQEIALSAAVTDGLEANRFMKRAASVRSWMAPRPYSGPGVDSLPVPSAVASRYQPDDLGDFDD
ncbi:hypothetical protein [Rhodococcus sp. IEGM 1379]|uniref:hypothetical protein n=1 Tax=Rhodococcus sp. IEGM 1379 TaxID=3047086 RepID=UPI0024B82A52|nr:hypothetical protein [Rhodococcus sp. IEGM 1379]MDI9914370.1 hypothetical protein [Rhodococcus sp. IEGM 1379]